MYISIGTRSQPKIAAVCSAFSRYPELCFRDSDRLQFVILPAEKRGESHVPGIDPVSRISRNPLTLEETVTGAKNRAYEAFQHCMTQYGSCDYGVGIEAGLFPVPGTKTGYLDTSICAIYNGSDYAIGGSPLFEYPEAVTERILNGEEAGLISDFFGNTAKGRPGVIGPLTSGRVNRDEFDHYAVMMALTRIVSDQLYKKN